jgi:hypothetical protein
MKKTASLLAAVAILLYFAAPSFAKKALNEGDLDRITAAGEPTIIQVSGVSIEASSVITTNGAGVETVTGGDATLEVSYSDTDASELTLGDNAQNNLRALVLNNVIGENQIANALNIISGGSVSGTGQGSQANTVTQSWGAVKVTGVESLTLSEDASEGEDAEAETSADGDATINNNDKCVGFSCNGDATASSAASTSASTSVATSVAALAIAYPEYMSADVIVHVEDVEIASSVGDAELSVGVEKAGESSLSLGTGAQNTLAALVVNNVAGRNQVANGINIVGGTLTVGSATPNVAIVSGGAGAVASQSNTIGQYRGTPINAPQPVAIAIGAASAASDGSSAAVAGGLGIAGSQLQIIPIP